MDPECLPRSLAQRVSPPPLTRPRPNKRRKLNSQSSIEQEQHQQHQQQRKQQEQPRQNVQGFKSPASPRPAAIEAGLTRVEDPVRFFSTLFGRVRRSQAGEPALSVDGFSSLFLRNAGNPQGRHFVVHQHDHPRAGLHYDLRLQVSATSSCSWAIPYGLPGNPNERCAGNHGRRQAVETRVHALDSHLVESAGRSSGSMLIWDTGEYEVLPYEKGGHVRRKAGRGEQTTPDEEESGDDEGPECQASSQTERLCGAFRAGKIRVRLKGSRLPEGYTIAIYLSRKARHSIDPERAVAAEQKESQMHGMLRRIGSPAGREDSSDGLNNENTTSQRADWASDEENAGTEDSSIRLNNAYPGSQNIIGSVRSRFWFVTLDKASCGFIKGKDADGRVEWKLESQSLAGKYPFFVRGRDVERSVVTGRRAAEVIRDEGPDGFYVQRAGWRPILK